MPPKSQANRNILQKGKIVGVYHCNECKKIILPARLYREEEFKYLNCGDCDEVVGLTIWSSHIPITLNDFKRRMKKYYRDSDTSCL